VRQKVGRIRRLIRGCRWQTIADVNAAGVEQFLARIKAKGKQLPTLDPARESYTKAELAALLGTTGNNVAQLVARHRLAAEGNGKARRFPRATAEVLRDRAARGAGVQTANYYLREVKAFARYLTDCHILGRDPLRKLKGGNVAVDRRHDRRSLDPEELSRLFAAARSSGRPFRGLTGPDRFMLYAAACGTGFREGELAALRPEWFKLDHRPPLIELPASVAKSRKATRQPIPGGLAEALRGFLEGRAPGRPVWPGTWAERGAEMLRRDLEAAGIPYAVEGPDGPLFADFHALRHSFITLLERLGVTPKEAQELARHSDVNLTLKRYTHKSLEELGAAVGGLRLLVTPDDPPALPAGAAALPRAELVRAVEELVALVALQAAVIEAAGLTTRVPVAPPVAPKLRTAANDGGPSRTGGGPLTAAG
jgi:integrase